MKVQCCCCGKTRTPDHQWKDEAAVATESVSHTYCPPCYEREVKSLRQAVLLHTPAAVA